MDEREVRELLSRAAESVEPGDDLAARAERRYRRRRARGRAVAAAVVVVVVGVGVATAAVVGSDRSSSPVLGKPAAVHVRTFSSLAFVDANVGYGVATTRPGQVALAKTEDGARSWQAVAVMPKGTYYVALAPGGTALLAWGDGPLYRTDDEGAHWQEAVHEHVTEVAVSSHRVWATAAATCQGRLRCHRKEIVSDDGGRTWSIGLLADEIEALATGTGSDELFAVDLPTSDAVRWQVTYTADGHRWTDHATPCPESSGPRLAVGGDNTSLMLVCGVDAEDRVYVSSDRGSTWTRTVALPERGRVADLVAVEGTDAGFFVGKRTAVGPGWPNGPLRYPVLDQWEWKARPQPIGDVYAFAPVPGAGTYFAAATGVYFDSARTGERELRTASRSAVPSTTTTTTQLSGVPATDVGSLSFVDARLGFGLYGEDLVRSRDGGRSWQHVNAVGFRRPSALHFENASDGVAWGGGVVQFTSDAGRGWKESGIDPTAIVLGWAEGRIWAYTPCRGSQPCGPRPLFVSDDVGATWKQVTTFDPGYSGAGLAPTDRSTAYVLDAASDREGALLRLKVTDDGGSTWRTESVPCPAGDDRFVASNGHSLLVGCPMIGSPSRRNALLASTDDGASWQRLPWPFDEMHFQTVTTSWLGYVGYQGSRGTYLSTDDGRSWHAPDLPFAPAVDGGLALYPLTGIGVWAQVIGSAPDASIWFSTDGLHWELRARGRE